MTNINQLYNERHNFKRAIKHDKTKLHCIVSKLKEYMYVYFTRKQCESATIKVIFWAHL